MPGSGQLSHSVSLTHSLWVPPCRGVRGCGSRRATLSSTDSTPSCGTSQAPGQGWVCSAGRGVGNRESGGIVPACCPSFLLETAHGSQERPPNKPVSWGLVVAVGAACLAKAPRAGRGHRRLLSSCAWFVGGTCDNVIFLLFLQ